MPVLAQVVAAARALVEEAAPGDRLDGDARSLFGATRAGSEGHHFAGGLVPQYQWVRHRPLPSAVDVVVDQQIGAAESGPGDADECLARSGLWHRRVFYGDVADAGSTFD